jgi:Family of unknown function (DUF5899)
MELYAGAALAKVGQSLQQQRDNLRANNRPNASEMPSMNNMYASQYYEITRDDERERGSANWNKAKDPWGTGMVPEPAYASMFQPLSAGLNPPKSMATANKEPVSTMAGTTVSREDFTHNNMQPFYGSTVKQNMNPDAMSSILESRTGRSDFKQRKQAVECFFEPTAGYSYVCGMPDTSDFMRSRIADFGRRANDFPIDQVRVGPGIGQGFTDRPEGGYQQAVTLDYVMPKTVDELRVATNPKLIPALKNPQGHMKGISQRGKIGQFEKRHPDTYYEQTPDMLLKTTGDHLKESLQPEQVVKATSRVDTHIDYKGAAFPHAGQPGSGSDDDYGKDGVLVYRNERDITGTRTVVNNVTSYVKAVIAPLLDIFRHNHKEYTIDSARVYGNMQAQIPSKPTTYDPVLGVMKTTIKEQLIHDTTIMNLHSAVDAPPVEGDDEARKTQRETLPEVCTTVGMASHKYNVTVYDVDSVAKTTVRQTTPESGSMYGFMDDKNNRGAYATIDVVAPLTQKQFTSDTEYSGVAESATDFRPMSQEADYNAEIDGTREMMNIASGNTPSAAGAFIGVTKDQIDMQTKRVMEDSITTRETGNYRAVQTSVLPIKPCDITHPVAREMDNPQIGRLDGDYVSALQSNPYTISLNPLRKDQ